MRQLGSLPQQPDAQRFADYLLTQGITAHIEEDSGAWDIWIREEEHLETAAAEFTAFEADPQAVQYQGVAEKAQAIRREEEARRKQAAKNIVDIRTGGGLSGTARRIPGVFLLIAACVLVALLTDVGMNWENQYVRLLMFCDPIPAMSRVEARLSGPADVFNNIAKGEVWRLATPMLLHGGWFHLVMNAFWLYYLGGQIEQRRGFWRLIIFTLLTSAAANVGQAAVSAFALNLPYPGSFGGMSGVVYAMLGYVWMKVYYDPNAGFRLGRYTLAFMLVWFFLCFSPMMSRGIANSAHAFGLFCGVVIGYLPQIFPGLKKIF